MVVWPELAALVYQEDLDALMERARTTARQEGIYLAIGVGLISTDPTALIIEENKLVMLDPQGQVVIDYSKYGCIFAFGMYTAQIPTVDTPFGRVGGVICCDLDFPYVIRQASQKSVDILLVPPGNRHRKASLSTHKWSRIEPSRMASRSFARRSRASLWASILSAEHSGPWTPHGQRSRYSWCSCQITMFLPSTRWSVTFLGG